MIAPIRLLMLNYEYPPIGGGAGRAHENILHQFAQRDDLDVDVLTSAPRPGFRREDLAENVRLHKVGLRKQQLHFWRKREVVAWLAKAFLRYERMTRRRRYHLVHAFFGFPSGWLCYGSRRRLPYVISLRGSDVPGYNERLGMDYRLLSPLFARIWDSASAVIANSTGLQDLAQRFRPDLPIGVIPNGVDTDTYRPPSDAALHRPIRLLTTCRLIQRKRIDLLIRATAELRRRDVPSHLTIAGEGNLERPLRALARQEGVEDDVTFLGRVPAQYIAGVYREHDVFVMSSEHEGMSNSMLEAMATGLPIVTTPCEGVEELIDGNGVVVASAAPESIAEGVRSATSSESVYQEMRARSAAKARTMSWQAVAAAYVRLYRGVLAPGGTHDRRRPGPGSGAEAAR